MQQSTDFLSKEKCKGLRETDRFPWAYGELPFVMGREAAGLLRDKQDWQDTTGLKSPRRLAVFPVESEVVTDPFVPFYGQWNPANHAGFETTLSPITGFEEYCF